MIRSMLCLSALLIALVVLLAANSADATPLTVANFSFEAEVLSDGDYTLGVDPLGWTYVGSSLVGTWNPTIADITPTHLDNVAYVYDGYIAQTLTDVLSVNTVYTLQADVGDAVGGTDTTATVQLFAGTTLLVENAVPLNPADGTFLTGSVNYTALPGDPNLGQALQIRLRSNANGELELDNVRLDATAVAVVAVVPEPSTFVLAALGLGFLARRRQSRRV